MAQSAFDRRRINGPDESCAPNFEPDDDASSWRAGMPRQGRSNTDIRPIFLQPGLIGKANGSAYLETEKTKIACAVYGPRQPKNIPYSDKGRLNVEVKFAPFSCAKRRAPMRDAEDRSIAVLIHQALVASVRLKLLPKSTIDVFVTIIENDGIEGCIAGGSIAASTALADAGVEMIGLSMSCSAALIGQEIWLDPTEVESSAADGSLVLACLPSLGTVVNVWQNGDMTIEQVLECMKMCQERCNDIHAVVVRALLRNARTT